MLGRHASAYHEVSTIYSRDASVRAVRKLQEIILAISRNEFNPDAPRSAYFKPVAAVQSTAEGSDKVEELWIKDESEDGGSVSSDSPSENEESEEEMVPPAKCIRVSLARLESSHFWKHKQTKVVHYCENLTVSQMSEGVVFACGRAVSANYLGAKEFDSTWMCKMCKSKALKDGALGPRKKQ